MSNLSDPEEILQKQAAMAMQKAAHDLLHAALHMERGELNRSAPLFKRATERIKDAASTVAVLVHEKEL